MAPPFFYLKRQIGNMSQKYPSLNEATHYYSGNYYKVGEETCFAWYLDGWVTSSSPPQFIKQIGTLLKTAPEAQQQTQELPATPAQGGGGTVDCSAAREGYNAGVPKLLRDLDMEARKAALEALVRDNEELGLYDMPLTPSMTEKNDNPRSTISANNR